MALCKLDLGLGYESRNLLLSVKGFTMFTRFVGWFARKKTKIQYLAVLLFFIGLTSIFCNEDLVLAQGGGGREVPLGVPILMIINAVSVDGQPLAGIPVLWSVTGRTAVSLDSRLTFTDSNGNTRNNLIIREEGDVTITVRAPSDAQLSDKVFEFTGTQALPGAQFDDLGSAGLNEPQIAIGEALETICKNPFIRGDLKNRALELKNNLTTNPEDVQNALQEIAYEEVSTMGATAIEVSDSLFRNIKVRLDAIRNHESGKNSFKGLVLDVLGEPITGPLFASSGPPSREMIESMDNSNSVIFDKIEFFINGTLSLGDRDSTSREQSFDFDTLGITAGVDYRIKRNLVLGLAFGFANTDNDYSSGSNLDTNSTSISLYGTYYKQNNFYFDGILSFVQDHYDLDRDVTYSIPDVTRVNQTAKSDTDGRQFSFGFSGGYDFNVGGFTIGPFARFNFVHVDIDSFHERMTNNFQPGSQLNFDIDNQDIKSLTTILGGQVSYAINTNRAVLLPQLRLEWEHEYKDNTRDIHAKFANDPFNTQIIIPTEDPDRNFFNVGIGLSSTFKGGKSAFIHYEAVVGRENITKHSIALGARFEF